MDKFKNEGWSFGRFVPAWLSKSEGQKAYDSHRARLVKLLNKRFEEAQSALTNKDVGKLLFAMCAKRPKVI
jgi:superoxide dismutase